jgi:hypothetical protein
MRMHGSEIPRVTALDRLLQAVPAWGKCTRSGEDQTAITAAVPRAGGPHRIFRILDVETRPAFARIREAGGGLSGFAT